jgi:hypothetical protein
MRSWESVVVILPHPFEFLFSLCQARIRTRRSSKEDASPQGKSVRCVRLGISYPFVRGQMVVLMDRAWDREFLKSCDQCRYVYESKGTLFQCGEQSGNVYEN